MAIHRLLGWLESQGERPLAWAHGDTPDLRLEYTGGPVGVEITTPTIPRTAKADQRLSDLADAIEDALTAPEVGWQVTLAAELPPRRTVGDPDRALVRDQRAAVVAAVTALAQRGGGTMDRSQLHGLGVDGLDAVGLERAGCRVTVVRATEGWHDISEMQASFLAALERKKSKAGSYRHQRLWLLFVTGGSGRPIAEHHLPDSFDIAPYERALLLRLSTRRDEAAPPVFDITPTPETLPTSSP